MLKVQINESFVYLFNAVVFSSLSYDIVLWETATRIVKIKYCLNMYVIVAQNLHENNFSIVVNS